MPTTRTYQVGIEGRSYRLDDLSGPWIDNSIYISSTKVSSSFYDVETDPTNGDKVIVVGQATLGNNRLGIYVSSDAGANWTQPGGNYGSAITPGTGFFWNELYYYDTDTIFVVGNNGYMVISIDGGLTFNLTTQVPAAPACSTCVPGINTLYSVHFISDLTGVVGMDACIATTINAGASWTISPVINALPTGDASTISGVHMSSNGLVINALSYTGMFRSIDGGLTWTNTYQFTNSVGRHLTWINDNELWAFGIEDVIIKSTDAGLTWSVVRPQNQQGPTHLAGHFYQGQNGFFSSTNSVKFTTDGATTDTNSDTRNFPVTAIWTWFNAPTCYKLTPCDDAYPTLYVTNDYSSIVDSYIKVCPDNIPTNQINVPTGNAFSIPYTQTNLVYDLEDCCDETNIISISNYNLNSYLTSNSILQITQLSGVCWRVKKATVGTPPVTFTGNLTGVVYANCQTCLSDFPCSPVPLPILTSCMCFLVEETQECENAITLVNLDTPSPFVSCIACEAQNNGPCYLLTDCDDPEHTIVTSDDLLSYLNQVIQIESCPGYCFTVTYADNCLGAQSVLPITKSFQTCDLCNYIPEVPTNLITRRVKPGYDTPACPPEYTEKVSCTFGEAMYDEVLSKRYGLQDCCPIDAQRWIIKKELLDLKVLNIANPDKPICYNYVIEQKSGTNTFKYIDCTGCLQTVILTDSITTVCAMYKPSVVCPTDNLDYTITFTDTPCESS